MAVRSTRAGLGLLLAGWALASAVILLEAENLWLDSLFRARWHRFPSLVPEQGSAIWVVVFFAIGVSCLLLVACLVFVIRLHGLKGLETWGTMSLAGLAIVLSVAWFRATGMDAGNAPGAPPHTVTLKWNASTSAVDGYNVYRRLLPNGFAEKVNRDPVHGLSFVDVHVASGVKYSYTVRAVGHGGESVDCTPAEADVP